MGNLHPITRPVQLAEKPHRIASHQHRTPQLGGLT